MTIIVYCLIAVANACTWSILAVLAGASQERALMCWVLVFFLSLWMMMFMGGAHITGTGWFDD